MSGTKKLSIAAALLVMLCSGFYYLLVSERIWFENPNYGVHYGGQDSGSLQVYQSVNGKIYIYLIGKSDLQAVFLVDKNTHKVGYANDYLNRFPLIGFTIDEPVSYNISADDEKTGFDPQLEIQPETISFYGNSNDVSARKRIVINFYDN